MAFQGDKKEGTWFLAEAETRLKNWLVPKVPKSIETYHLTLTTLLWCAMIILFSFLANYCIHFLWLVSFAIFGQYITDLLDGEIGRRRNTGLIKWGYYMDHFLDYLFLCSILIGYGLMVENQNKYIMFYILALFGGFMVNSFLSFAARGTFRISYLGVGPTEVRLVFIIANALIVFFHDKTDIARVLPYVLAGATFALFVTVFQTQKELWKIDMEKRRDAEK
ncbi:MAG: CDP-alcohol phosphatidyltransferase family protein [Pontiellaceae bacterium]|nr:CDP-alcohol phosphatidyltransferase family protein [Pontiellaceae bacterium]MBN2785976.1 CDP-alcohol phosphatidyltransferase family protein [Pontiellaceae bacterium]